MAEHRAWGVQHLLPTVHITRNTLESNLQSLLYFQLLNYIPKISISLFTLLYIS